MFFVQKGLCLFHSIDKFDILGNSVICVFFLLRLGWHREAGAEQESELLLNYPLKIIWI